MKKYLSILLGLLIFCACTSEKPLAFENLAIYESDANKQGEINFNSYKDSETINRADNLLKGNINFNDFINYVHSIIDNPVPANVTFPAVKYIEGSWTYCMIAETQYTGFDFNEIGYADISLNYEKETMIIVLHPRIGHSGYEIYPETDDMVNYLPFEGGQRNNGSFVLDDNDGLMMAVNYYYVDGGREFVWADLYLSETEYARVLFFRGQ